MYISILCLNGLWLLIEAVFFYALVRGAKLVIAFPLALFAGLIAFMVECGFAPFRFHGMATAAWAIFVHAPLVLLGLGIRYRKHKRRTMASLAAAFAIVIVGIDAFFYEPHALVMSTARVHAPSTLRIAVMSDFQAAEIGAYELRVIQRLAAIEPDLILLAGDYIQVYDDRRPKVVRDFREAWKAAKFHPRLGTYAVRGDVEILGWEEEIFGGLDVVTSDVTRTITTSEITFTLLSLDDSANTHLVLPNVTAGTNIVIGHRPDYALGKGPPALLVAGHTHGGQVQIPFFGPPITLSAVPRSWAGGGLHAIGDGRSLLVTRGAGVEHADDAPLLRFNCRPEIVRVDLAP